MALIDVIKFFFSGEVSSGLRHVELGVPFDALKEINGWSIEVFDEKDLFPQSDALGTPLLHRDANDYLHGKRRGMHLWHESGVGLSIQVGPATHSTVDPDGNGEGYVGAEIMLMRQEGVTFSKGLTNLFGDESEPRGCVSADGIAALAGIIETEMRVKARKGGPR